MRILELKAMRGPNYWSVKRHHLIVMRLDIEDLEQKPTDKIPGFYERIVSAAAQHVQPPL
jgi:cyanophycin synthetase